MVEFNLVLSTDQIFRKSYKRSTTKGIEVINHKDIIQKLENNDINKSKPSVTIVKFFIINKINKSLQKENIKKIYYKIDLIDHSILDSINLILKVYNNISLNLILHEDIEVEEFEGIFDSIRKMV